MALKKKAPETHPSGIPVLEEVPPMSTMAQAGKLSPMNLDNTEDKSVSTDTMESTVNLVADIFHLGGKGYMLREFKQGKDTCTAILSNSDFVVAVTVLKPSDWGIGEDK
jgi:hypothetical protein